MVNRSGNRSSRRSRLNSLQKFLHNRPLTFWGSLLLGLFLVGSVAVNGLFNPAPSELETPAPLPTPQKSVADDGVPVWLFGAIAFSCATGCGLILASLRLRQMEQRRYRRRKVKKPKPSPPVAIAPPPSPTLAEIPPPLDVPPPPPKVISFQIKAPTVPKNPGNRQSNLPIPPLEVTILPPDAKHPLDGNQDTLTESIDLRQSQSLSSLLGKTSYHQL